MHVTANIEFKAGYGHTGKDYEVLVWVVSARTLFAYIGEYETNISGL
jgi:hypothetical protein